MAKNASALLVDIYTKEEVTARNARHAVKMTAHAVTATTAGSILISANASCVALVEIQKIMFQAQEQIHVSDSVVAHFAYNVVRRSARVAARCVSIAAVPGLTAGVGIARYALTRPKAATARLVHRAKSSGKTAVASSVATEKSA